VSPRALPIELYGDGIAEAATAGRAVPGWHLVESPAHRRANPFARWCGRPSPSDATLLARCCGPTVDVGCGPGRLAAELSRRGVACLGVDTCDTAVKLARRSGATAIQRSVFDPLPREGWWRVALLADGNIGIGADPDRLLRRISEIIAECGTVLCEVDPPGEHTGIRRYRIESPNGVCSSWFDWARVSVDDIEALAGACGWCEESRWTVAGRWFVTLVRQ
jgi:SAM-dependent methyltransferase